MKLRQFIKGLSVMTITAVMSTSLLSVGNVYAEEAKTVDKETVKIKYSNSVDKVYLSEEDNVAVSQVFLSTLGMEINDKTKLDKYGEVEIIDDSTTFSIDYDHSSIAKENMGETYIITYGWYKDSKGKIDAYECFIGPDSPMVYQYFGVDYEKVDENAYKIEDINAGSLMIIATPYNDNSIHWTYAITQSDYKQNTTFNFLTENEIKDDNVITNVPSKVKLEKGKTLTLKPTITKGTTNKITYNSSKKAVASVSSKGKITAKKTGVATITVKCGTVRRKVKVEVVNKNTKLTLSKKTVTLKKGKSASVTAKTTANTVAVTATSNKSKVAKVSVKNKKITVKAIGKGNAKITVKCGSKKATISVKVN